MDWKTAIAALLALLPALLPALLALAGALLPALLPALLALAGALAGALVGGFVTPLVSADRTRALWLLQQRADTYTDVAAVGFLMNDCAILIAEADPASRARLDEIDKTLEKLGPRMSVFAGDSVMKTFGALFGAWFALRRAATDRHPDDGGLGHDHPTVLAVGTSVNALHESCRNAVAPRQLPFGLRRG